jgi:DNA-binding NarL/FixJ family response regulator
MRMKQVLIVDDHTLFRQILVVVLEAHTDLKENVQAGSLAEARRALDELDQQVDLAIVDLDLPEGDATELLEDLRKVGIPVMAFTSDPSLEQRGRALRAGAGEVLTPASSGEQIIDAAERLVGG